MSAEAREELRRKIEKNKEARKALLAKAAKPFMLRGTRKLRNNAYTVREAPPDALVIPAGRRPKPAADYLTGPRMVADFGDKAARNEEGAVLAPYAADMLVGRSAVGHQPHVMITDETDAVLANIVPEAAAMIKPNITKEALKLRRGLFVPVEQPGLEGWLARQEEYIVSLPVRDIEILKSYTSHGDRLVNGYCRGALDDIGDLITSMIREDNVPLAYSFYDQYREYSKKGLTLKPRKDYIDEEGELYMPAFKDTLMTNLAFFRKPKNIGTLLEQYKQELIRIIEGAPRLTYPLITYRGIQSESHMSGSTFKNGDFLSTTLDPFSVLPFTKEYTDDSGRLKTKFNCCVYEMNIDKKVPCMYMQFLSNYANEFEVLVPPGMEVKLGKEVRVKVKPARRAEEKEALLEGISTENVLVVSADVRKPVKPPRVAGISLAKRATKFGTRKH